MARKEHIVRYTAKQLAAKRRASRTDWAKAAATTNAELEASIAADPDEAGMVMDWDSVTVELPKPKADLHMRIDRDVLISSAKPAKATRPASMLCCALTSPACAAITDTAALEPPMMRAI
jgi:hypothetical protein